MQMLRSRELPSLPGSAGTMGCDSDGTPAFTAHPSPVYHCKLKDCTAPCKVINLLPPAGLSSTKGVGKIPVAGARNFGAVRTWGVDDEGAS